VQEYKKVCLARWVYRYFAITPLLGINTQITASIAAMHFPAMTDFVIMVENVGQMFVTGPEVVKEVLSQDVSFEELGGARTHASKSGVAHFIAKNEFECMDEIKKLLSYIPQNNTEEPPLVEGIDDPNRIEPNLINILPENPYQQYDMK
jgi:acetyl-CoA/propionyl-CoA carboxylase